MKHDFYRNGDDGIPSGILDIHDDVVLSLCKVCGQAEGELTPSCPGAPAEKPSVKAARQRKERKKPVAITMGCVAAILGVSKTMTRAQVLRQMVRQYHGAESEYVSNVAAEYGEKSREAAIASLEAYAKRPVVHTSGGGELFSGNFLLIASAKHPGDGLAFVRMPFGKRSAVDSADFDPLDAQPHMYAQMQFEMYFNGCSWGVFFQWSVMAHNAEFVKFDESFIEQNIDQITAFYSEYLAERSNKAHLEPLLPSIDNDKARKALAEYDELCVAEANIKERKRELLEGMQAMAGDRSVMICGRKLQRTETAGSVSYAAVVREHLPSLDLAKYRGAPSVSWKLS